MMADKQLSGQQRRLRALLKDVVLDLVLAWLFYVISTKVPPAEEETLSEQLSQGARCTLSSVLACAMICVALIDIFGSSRAASALERKWHAPEFGGNYVYFTIQSLHLSVVYLCYSAYAEIADAAAGMRTFCHAFALFVGTLAAAMTLLFLALNWCDRAWHREVEDSAAHRAGHPTKRNALIVHLPSIVIHFLDLTVVKDRTLLRAATPHAGVLLVAFAAYVGVYTAWITLNWAFNGGYWPYPFVRSVLEGERHCVFVMTFVGSSCSNVFSWLISFLFRSVLEAPQLGEEPAVALDEGALAPDTCCSRPLRWVGFLVAVVGAFSVIFAALSLVAVSAGRLLTVLHFESSHNLTRSPEHILILSGVRLGRDRCQRRAPRRRGALHSRRDEPHSVRKVK